MTDLRPGSLVAFRLQSGSGHLGHVENLTDQYVTVLVHHTDIMAGTRLAIPREQITAVEATADGSDDTVLDRLRESFTTADTGDAMTDQPTPPTGVTAAARGETEPGDTAAGTPRFRVQVTVSRWDDDSYKPLVTATETDVGFDGAAAAAIISAREAIVTRARSQMEAADALLRALDGYRP